MSGPKNENLIDRHGFRANVGIMVADGQGRVLWARRNGQDAWQFPQGGIHEGESAEQAMFRELNEEIGLKPQDVEIIGETQGWLRYKLPEALIRKNSKPLCIGQKQKWFLLKMLANDDQVKFDNTNERPEFDHWQWVSYWYPLGQVVSFKRDVYRRAMRELSAKHARIVRNA